MKLFVPGRLCLFGEHTDWAGHYRTMNADINPGAAIVTNMDALGKWCADHGHPLTVDSCPDGKQFSMGDASGRFTYIEDQDGTLIEFVETYRISVAKKLGCYINLLYRNREKPLSKLLFRAMKMNRKKF